MTSWELPATWGRLRGHAWGRLLAPVVTVAVGLIVLSAGLLGHSQSPTVTNVHTTWGMVVGYDEVRTHSGAVDYYAVVLYRPTPSASPVLFNDPNATTVSPAIGSRVRVDFQPKHPSDAHVISELYDWVPWAVTGIGGVMVVYGAAGLYLLARRRHTAAAARAG